MPYVRNLEPAFASAVTVQSCTLIVTLPQRCSSQQCFHKDETTSLTRQQEQSGEAGQVGIAVVVTHPQVINKAVDHWRKENAKTES